MDQSKADAIRKDRGKVYGDPLVNHWGIAHMWVPLLMPHWEAIKSGRPVPPWVVSLLLAALKLDRMRFRFQEDNYDDAMIYLEFTKKWQKMWQEDLGSFKKELTDAGYVNQTVPQENHGGATTGGSRVQGRDSHT